MEAEKKKAIGELLCDVITGHPHEIMIGDETVLLYPVTLAKTFLFQQLVEKMDANVRMLKDFPSLECLRVVSSHREDVCQLLALHATPNNARDLFDLRSRAVRVSVFSRLKDDHLAGLLMSALSWDRTEELEEYLGIRSERDRLDEVLKVRHERAHENYLSFGGVSLFGGFIGRLKELGYSDAEILYERGYMFLRLMLDDHVTSIYMDDEELDDTPQALGGRLLDGDDSAILAQLERALKIK